MIAGQIYHIVISICEINDLYQSPVLRLGPTLIRNRACCDVSQCPTYSTLYLAIGIVVFIDCSLGHIVQL
jgi:hypothetical protein